jgi:hypothetical protein
MYSLFVAGNHGIPGPQLRQRIDAQRSEWLGPPLSSRAGTSGSDTSGESTDNTGLEDELYQATISSARQDATGPKQPRMSPSVGVNTARLTQAREPADTTAVQSGSGETVFSK